MKKRTIKEYDVKSKKVLMRVDFNVPMDEDGKIMDDTKIRFSLETIKYLNDQKAKLILMSHLGNPNGRMVRSLSLEPIAKKLGDMLGKNIFFAPELTGDKVEEMIEEMLPGDIMLLENTRFDPGDEKNASSLAKKLASYADVFVNDAFSTCNKDHASVVGVSKYLETYSGFRLAEEVEKMSNIFERITRPITIVLGGNNLDGKIELFDKFVDKIDHFLLGGDLANSVLYAMGYDLGEKYNEREKIKQIKDIVKVVTANEKKIILPVDLLVSDEVSPDTERAVIPTRFMHSKLKVLDIGPKTIKLFSQIIDDSSTIVWSGPMGNSDYNEFLEGTLRIAEHIGSKYGNTVVGGTETIEALNRLKFSVSRFTLLTPAGGAMLEYLKKGALPGLENIPKVWGV